MPGVTQLLNDPLDVEWLKETHLKREANLPQFESFELAGNEDSPEAITLHRCRFPTLLDAPVAQFKLDSRGRLKSLQVL